MARSFVHAPIEEHLPTEDPERLLDGGEITLEVSALGRDGFVDQAPDSLGSRDSARTRQLVEG